MERSPIRQLGLNFNRLVTELGQDVLWLEFPNAGGTAPDIPVAIDTVNYSQSGKIPVSVMSENTPWISFKRNSGLRRWKYSGQRKKK